MKKSNSVNSLLNDDESKIDVLPTGVKTDPFSNPKIELAQLKNSTDLFKGDRRGGERAAQTDRRQFLRPTSQLKRKGFFAAAVVLIILLAACLWVFK